MSLESISLAIQNTQLFTAMRESMLVYPIVMSLHLSSIAVFGGMILMTDLRLLGLAMKSITITDMVRQTRYWKWGGFVLMIGCGIMLGGSKLADYYDNPYFVTKMTLLLLVGVHAMVFRRRVYANTQELDRLTVMPRVVKVAACSSLLLWFTIMAMGRLIAYYDKPEDANPATASTQLDR